MGRTAYRRYMLGLLLVILAFNYLDRVALGLLMEAIKTDLRLSDTQLGLLTGLAFAIFYSLMGLPLARWADRGNRVTIISLTTAVWSGAVVLCGFAGSFLQLMLARIVVAVGEAGAMPPAQSLIADNFSRSERPRAFAIYLLGSPLSSLVGYFAAGRLAELYGWRTTFILLGLPGLVLAVLAWRTLREPRTPWSKEATPAPAVPDRVESVPGFRETLATLWGIPSFRHLLFCFSVVCLFGYGIQMWQPTFFIRSFGVSTSELGVWLALIYGLGGLIGTLLGGELATRLASRDERLQLHMLGLMFALFGLMSCAIYLVPDYATALILLGIATTAGALTNAPLFATIQSLVPDRMRATSIALLYLFANLIGMGLGPLAAGVMSDALRPRFGDESLRYALLLLCPGYLWAGWHLLKASRTVTADIAEQEQQLGVST